MNEPWVSAQLRATERVRVVHVSTAHASGDVRIYEREGRSLASAGFDVRIVAHGPAPTHHSILFEEVAAPSRYRTHRILSSSVRAARAIRGDDRALFHLHDPELIPLGLRLASKGSPVIWDAHEDYHSQFVDGGAKDYLHRALRPPARWATVQMLKRIDQAAAGVVAATPLIASRYRNARTTVVGNEARTSDFAMCQPQFDNRLALFTGSVSHSHAFGPVVEAVASVPGLAMAVAGRTPNPSLWKWAEGRLGPRIQYLGWLDRGGLARAMSSASVGVVSYADTEAYANASPTKAHEFAAAGLPTVSTPNRCNAKALRQSGSGWLAADFSAEGIREALLIATSDQERWNQASHAARRWSVVYGSWEGSERRLLDLYDLILGTGRVG